MKRESVMNLEYPVIGQWFRRLNGTLFEVVAVDEAARTIEVQQFDGTIDEIDLENWADLFLVEVSAPEDWSGSLDLSSDDYGVDLDRPAGDSHESPLDGLDTKD